MKNALLSAAAALSSLAVVGAAHAQPAAPDAQWYVRGDAGYSFQSDVNSTPKVKGDGGWTIDAAVGRAFGPNVRGEGEVLYSEDDQKSNDGKIKVVAGLLNGYYDFDTGTAFRPFVGAGFGIAQVKLDGGPIHDDDTGFAYQLQTGVSYPINPQLSAQVAYRYLGVNDVKLGEGLMHLNGDYHNQAVTAGLTYRFGL
jgi:opacity protein-like surface antigen